MEKQRYYTIWLGLICIGMFILQNLFSGFTEALVLNGDSLYQPWRFVTAVFLHGGMVHLLYNMFALFFFGIILEKLIGSTRFLLIFLVSGIFANVFSFSFYPSSLGASGAIMAVIGVVAALRPMMSVWAFNLPMPMFVAAILWSVGSFLGIFGFGDKGVGHIAHLSGIVIGVFYGLFIRFTTKKTGVKEDKIVIDESAVRDWEEYYVG